MFFKDMYGILRTQRKRLKTLLRRPDIKSEKIGPWQKQS